MARKEPNPTPTPMALSTVLSPEALSAAQFALLRALGELLEGAADQVADLRDSGLSKYPLCVDARPVFDWIAETVEALDALGWVDVIASHDARDQEPAG